jgi:nicotinamide-nucleotide amidase
MKPAPALRIEQISTGDEVVTGQIVDTNAAWLSEQVFELGAYMARRTTVGDVREEIVAALREAASRADVVAVTGGLGPTLDDLTAESAAEAFGCPLVLDEEQFARLRARFAAMGRTFTENNARQAMIPGGAEVLPNEWGTAPGFVVPAGPGRGEVWFFPGVPREFQGLVERFLLPRLRARLAAAGVHRHRIILPCYGLAESHLDARIRPLLPDHPFVRYGTRTRFPENWAVFVGEGESDEVARARCEALVARAREVLGPSVYGEEGRSFAAVTLDALRARGWRVGLAESLTAGLAASLLAEVPGASDVLLGSAVTYAEALKTRWLGVPAATLATDGVVSEACARAMAEGARDATGADVAVSLTGWADAGGAGEAGTVWAAIAGAGETRAVCRRFPLARNRVRLAAAYLALDLLRRRALGLE